MMSDNLERIRMTAKHLVQSTLRRVGIQVLRYQPGRAELLDRLAIDLVLDVGANAGQYVSRLRHDGYVGRILSFEPLSEAFSILAARAAHDPNWECMNLALSNIDGQGLLNVAGNSVSSSFMPMLESHRHSAPSSVYTGEERVRTARLDTFIDKLAGHRTYLKLDVQGFELVVLAGAELALQQIVALEIELSLTPLYEGAPLIEEVIASLRAYGFGLFSLAPGFQDPETGRVLQMDGLFVR
jgi:FkbM family methyltransferase